MTTKTVLVTGANGYIGNAVAKAFRRAGWTTYGAIRRDKDAFDLASHEIHPIIGSPDDISFVKQLDDVSFDVIVSNTEDTSDADNHFKKVRVMLDALVGRGQQSGKRPLVMFTSGCKDYGVMDMKHGDAGLAPHTEESPMNPPAPLVPRCDFGLFLLEGEHPSYDATVLRPTIVYGNSSSHYGSLFDLAEDSKSELVLKADPDAIMHSLHVDDCGDAYVSLAEHPNRAEVAQQAFNISNDMYETAQEVGDALAKSYGLTLKFDVPSVQAPMGGGAHSLANFWQWVGSARIRALTGWKEQRQTFVEGIDEYRLAYEARKQAKA
jgi:nucleoside-diphosphate-sugar epimerase